MEKNKEVTIKDLKQFGIVLALILWVFGAIQFFKGRDIYIWFAAAGMVSAGMAVFAVPGLRPVYKGFIKLAHAIGWVNARVILFLVYYLLVFPIGVLMRLAGKDSMSANWDKKSDTYWIERPLVVDTKESLENQF
ncbi:MAG TPA: SxtJ family membrane protein [Candidatus Omnitrophota bacterium]|nr:SxtJ family membrane protein [Candidatus Omnitrophota bacterium]HPS19494.1 SxtJ family membrane protein [Candidatus Omnitrophota bacterium]